MELGGDQIKSGGRKASDVKEAWGLTTAVSHSSPLPPRICIHNGDSYHGFQQQALEEPHWPDGIAPWAGCLTPRSK